MNMQKINKIAHLYTQRLNNYLKGLQFKENQDLYQQLISSKPKLEDWTRKDDFTLSDVADIREAFSAYIMGADDRFRTEKDLQSALMRSADFAIWTAVVDTYDRIVSYVVDNFAEDIYRAKHCNNRPYSELIATAITSALSQSSLRSAMMYEKRVKI